MKKQQEALNISENDMDIDIETQNLELVCVNSKNATLQVSDPVPES